MKTIKSSKILAILIVASITLIGLGSLTDAIDKIIKFNHSYISEVAIDQKSVEHILPSPKTINKQASSISTVVVAGCIVALFVSITMFFIRWKGNIKNIREKMLRPSRLKVYNETREFLHFCTTYWTKHCQGMVKGTNDLINNLNSFKNSIKSEWPLNMPSVESNIKDVIKKTWRLQRFIDSIAILRPPNKDYYDIEDKIHDLVDWFAQQEKDIEKLFEPYLKL